MPVSYLALRYKSTEIIVLEYHIEADTRKRTG
jgi:hypothetical protein